MRKDVDYISVSVTLFKDLNDSYRTLTILETFTSDIDSINEKICRQIQIKVVDVSYSTWTG